MNKKAVTNPKALNIIGTIFFIWGLVAIISGLMYSETGIAPILWMSYIGLIILAIGMLRKDSNLIASQLAIIGIPYILWNVDFFHQLFTNSTLFGITDYIFLSGDLLEKAIALQHIFNVPLSLYSIHLIGLHKTNFWKISISQVTIVFLISRLVTNYEENVNCVYHNCANFTLGFPYVIEWFASMLVMIFISSWFLIKIFKKPEKEKIK